MRNWKALVSLTKMKQIGFIVLVALVCNSGAVPAQDAAPKEEDFLYGYFPRDFLWGLATSSYQVEGGWNSDGKGENIWDYWSHMDNGSNIADGKNGDVACDSYNRIPQDVELLKDMGAQFYRFSISWARVVPTGHVRDGVSQAGLNYYSRLIDALRAEGIEPFVTLYHWDLPLQLLQEGGWLNDKINDDFADYAKVVFSALGNRVKYWLSFNEPYIFCRADWTYGIHDPFEEPPETMYKCAHNVVKSHALAYRIYDSEFRPTQRGLFGITLNVDYPEAKNESDPTHRDASDRAMHFLYGWWANPIVFGEYPPIMRELIDRKSPPGNSRLPSFNSVWTAIINGSTDFLGLNHYSTNYVQPAADGESDGLNGDANIKTEGCSTCNQSGIGWTVVPHGIRRVLTWVYQEYKLPIYVTENGYGAREDEGLDDTGRQNYYWFYINEVLKSIVYDGSDVRSYTAWSLIDNYEWGMGYTARFGVNYVNFTDPNYTRTPKDSARMLTKLFADNGFPAPQA